MEHGIFDLGIVTRSPTEPGKVLVNLSFYDYPYENERKKRQLVCLAVEVTITLSKVSGGTGRTPRNHTIG